MVVLLILALIAIRPVLHFGRHVRGTLARRYPLQAIRLAPVIVWLRIVWATYQVLSKVPSIYLLSLPSGVADSLARITPVINFGIDDFVSTSPLQCVGLGGFLDRLIFCITMPLVVIAVCIFFVASGMQEELDAAEVRASTVTTTLLRLQHAAPSILFVSFLAFPIVSTMTFRAFVCDPFGETSYLKVDYSVVCGSAAHATIMMWATLGIIIYPIGITLMYGVLLFCVRNEVLNSEHNELSNALSFLHRPFKPSFFWWELTQVSQKLILVGFFSLQPFHPGSFTQLLFGMSVALLFAMAQLQVQPYCSRFDNLLAGASSISLVLFFISNVLYRVYELTVTFEPVEAQLSNAWASRRFTLSFWFIAVIMFLSIFGSIIAMVVLYTIESITVKLAPTIRLVSTGSEPELSLPEHPDKCKFHGFMSHCGRLCFQQLFSARTSLFIMLISPPLLSRSVGKRSRSGAHRSPHAEAVDTEHPYLAGR